MSIIKESTVLVILGASGDLARKKLFPALFGLEKRNLLPPSLRIVGFAPDEMAREEFVGMIEQGARTDSPKFAEQLKGFVSCCSYVSGHAGGDAAFQALRSQIDSLGEGKKEQHRLFYMALPPTAFVPVSEGLKRFCAEGRGERRIIIEKPFGHDLDSSRELQQALDKHWDEEQIFRIDHYLGKEVVNNLLVLRFGNEIFGSVWSKRHISDIEISMTEAHGVEGRGSYFESTGAIRDVMQNHMTQIISLLTMERPRSFSASDLCNEKVRVLQWMPALSHEDTIIGQYGPSADGSKPGFRDEEDVPEDSICVTFCTAVARVENERWEGVPFVLKAGKALDATSTQIKINFHATPNANIFAPFGGMVPNTMTIRIQPNEGIFLSINSLVPDLNVKTEALDLDLSYHGQVGGEIPEAYEVLLLDALCGDFSRNVRADEVEESWRIFTPLLHQLERERVVPRGYAYGSPGPEGLSEFTKSFRRTPPSTEESGE